ncbi:MAG: glycosyltransferase family 2 protein [Candidatus Peregrinibacteria bacterium]|nr:glycosyltransferase family 2 protein [Candidatus Peregrinibacteria bacterium]
MLSIIIPVFNEEGVIESTIRTLHETLTSSGEEFEIVAVDDGSSDGTVKILSDLKLQELTIITHPQNRGYGASVKSGIRHSKGELIGTVDADGTYPLKDFPLLLTRLRERKADMVVGARTKRGVQIPLIRRPAKAVLNILANALSGMRIPDLNSGMRIFTRELAERFMHLYPQRFSFTITITLAALTNDYIVSYVPIDYYTRKGKSTLSSGMNGLKNFVNFLGIVVRIITYFRPLRFFIWPSLALLAAGTIMIVHTLRTESNVSDSGMLLLLTGLQIGLFGLLAEVVVRNRGTK